MKKGRKKSEIVSLLITAAIIVVLLFSGQTTAVELAISASDLAPDESSTTSFIVQVDIGTGEKVPIQNLTINFTLSSDSSSVKVCVFEPDGTPISDCDGLIIEPLNILGYGIYSDQWGYGFGSDGFENTSFSAGYAYESTGATGELKYNITWSTPAVSENTEHEIYFYAAASDGTNKFTYMTEEPTSITVMDSGSSSEDETAVAGAKSSLTYAFILMDDADGAKNNVISNLRLPTEMSGVAVSWASSNLNVINTTGRVTRPVNDTSVSLTATLSKNAASDQKIFSVTVLAQVAPSVPDAEGTIEVEDDATEVYIDEDDADELEMVTVPSTVTGVVKLNLGSLVDEAGDLPALPNDLTLVRETAVDGVEYKAEIPQNTIISGGSGWNGIINLPTVKETNDYSVASGSIKLVVDMGSSTEINFSEAVKITLSGQRGKRAGWVRGSSELTKITTQCNSATSPTNIFSSTAPRECYIDSGSDLLIWTYHFTEFASYSPTSGGGGGGSSSSSSTTASTDSTTVEMAQKDVVSLNVLGEEHTVTLSDIDSDGFVTIIFKSDPIRFILFSGMTQMLDLDNDAETDFSVKVVSADTSAKTAELEFRRYYESDTALTAVFVEPEAAAVPAEEPAPAVETTKETPQEEKETGMETVTGEVVKEIEETQKEEKEPSLINPVKEIKPEPITQVKTSKQTIFNLVIVAIIIAAVVTYMVLLKKGII